MIILFILFCNFVIMCIGSGCLIKGSTMKRQEKKHLEKTGTVYLRVTYPGQRPQMTGDQYITSGATCFLIVAFCVVMLCSAL